MHTNEFEKHSDYNKAHNRRKYWRLSYECYGADYAKGNDGEGVAILRKHEREDDSDHKRRVETATPWCFVGPILRKYNSFVFRKPFTFDRAVFGDFSKNINGNGTSMGDFMKARTLTAQIEAVSFILLDSTGPTGTMTQAQAATNPIIWKAVDADQVVQWHWHEGNLIWASILMSDVNGNQFIWKVDQTHVQRINVEVNNGLIEVTNVEEPQEHNYGGTPLVPLKPDFGSISQAAPIAELQKAVTRERSLLDEELWNSTYSMLWASGISAENFKDVVFGPKQVICLPQTGSSLNVIGGDVAQAGSIRMSISDNVKEIDRVSGTGANDESAESGIAKSFRFNDLATNLSELSKAALSAHRRAELLTAHALGKIDYVPAVYPTDFTMPILQTELNEVTSAMTAQLPEVLMAKLVKRFADRNFELSDEEQEQLKEQLKALGVLPDVIQLS